MRLVIAAIVLPLLLGSSCPKRGPSGGTGGSYTKDGSFVSSNNVAQPENPSHLSSQNTRVERDTSLIIPAGTTVKEVHLDGTNIASTFTYTLSAPATQSVRLRTQNDTAIGAAHRSFAADIAAKAKSLRPVQYAGIGLIIAAIALFYFKWPTPAIVCLASGIGLIVLSNVLISHSGVIAIVLGIGLVVLLIFYAYSRGALDDYLPARLDRKPKPKKPGEPDTVAELLQQTEIVAVPPVAKPPRKPVPPAGKVDTVSELLENTEIKPP
jgi:hypothetical protein